MNRILGVLPLHVPRQSQMKHNCYNNIQHKNLSGDHYIHVSYIMFPMKLNNGDLSPQLKFTLQNRERFFTRKSFGNDYNFTVT